MKSKDRMNKYSYIYICTIELLIIVFLYWYGGYFTKIMDFVMPEKQEVFYLDNTKFVGRESMFQTFSMNTADIAFVGDSLTERCEWGEYFPNQKVVNRGIGSDTSDGVLHRLDTVVNANPRKIYLMVGINDLAQDVKQKRIVENYNRILTQLKQSLPNTEIIVESVLPTDEKQGIDPDKIKALNTALESLCNQENVRYLDVYSAMVDETGQKIKSEYTIDGIHLNGNGYSAWVEQIGN